MDIKDHYRCAKILIDQFGLDAEAYAALKMQELMKMDDAKGSACWFAIENAIRDIRLMKASELH